MPENQNQTLSTHWTSVQAYTLAVICLLLGIACGWLIRGSKPAAATAPDSAGNTASAPMNTGVGSQSSPEQLTAMAAAQAAPLLEQLKSDPNNASLLAHLGNIYYDTQQFPVAIDYYQRALKIKPSDAGIRTDMATAYWYAGNADTAITELNQALHYEPNQPNALFNLGIVKWQGKMDVAGAVAVWKQLLATNPNYENKEKVLQLMAEAEKHSGMKAGTPAKTLPK